MRTWKTGLRFAAGGLVSLAVLYALSELLAPVHADTQARVALFEERRKTVEAVSVGNSHTAALDFGALGMQGFHFWDAGQDAFEGAFLLRYAAEQAPRMRYALVTASYGFERLNNAAMTSADYTAIRRRTYLRAGTPHFIPGDLNLWVRAWLAPIARSDQWSGVAARLAGRARPAARLAPGGLIVEPEPPRLSADSLARSARATAVIHETRAAESLANAPYTAGRVAEDLDALARELGERDVVLVLYTPPYHHTYLRAMPADVGEGTRRALQPALRYANVVWLDFAAHPAFTQRDHLFEDSDHLNPEGARLFSALLRRCLAALPAAGGSGASYPADCP